MPSVFKLKSFLTDQRKLETFLGWKPTVLMLCFVSTLLMHVEVVQQRARLLMLDPLCRSAWEYYEVIPILLGVIPCCMWVYLRVSRWIQQNACWLSGYVTQFSDTGWCYLNSCMQCPWRIWSIWSSVYVTIQEGRWLFDLVSLVKRVLGCMFLMWLRKSFTSYDVWGQFPMYHPHKLNESAWRPPSWIPGPHLP
jgi:hypothetical protein